jgi:hypothetical protein
VWCERKRKCVRVVERRQAWLYSAAASELSDRSGRGCQRWTASPNADTSSQNQ